MIYILDTYLLLDSRQQEIKILAVDSDDKLISIAQDKLLKDEQGTSSKLDIQFITLDIMDAGNAGVVFEEYLHKFQKDIFDVIFCFSVTMWIHLNHGDKGLERFFDFVRRWCKYLVLEPQPWKCYRTASRRMRRSHEPDFPYIDSIEHKCDKLLPYLIKQCEKAGFTKVCTFGETSWKRQILLFKAVM